MKRSTHKQLLGLASAFALFLVGTGSAQAAFTHSTEYQPFGPDGTANTHFTSTNSFGTFVDGIAVDEETQKLYVFNGIEPTQNDELVPRLYGFDISTPGDRTPLAGFPVAAPNSVRGSQMAIDKSAGGEGALYTLSEGAIRSFASNGTPREGFPVTLPKKPYGFGIAVDSKGNVWAADSTTATLEEYSSSGAHLNSISVIEQNNPTYLAFDLSNDNIFVAGGNSIWRYTAASNYTKGEQVLPESGPIAFDSRDGVFYIWGSQGISAYNEAFELIETLPAIREQSNMTVDEATGTVYLTGEVGHPNNEDVQQVAEYPGIVIPNAVTGGQVGRNAVSGHVDLAGGPEVTKCEVEFLPEEYFHKPQPEVQTVTLEGATGGTFGLTFVESHEPQRREEEERSNGTTKESVGNFTSSSNLIKNIPAYTRFSVGEELIGQGIPLGTTVTEFIDGQGGPGTVEMSQAATETIIESSFVATLPFDASAEVLQKALLLHSGSVEVTGPDGGPYRVEFNSVNQSDVPPLIGQTSALTPAGAKISTETLRNGGTGWKTDPLSAPCEPAVPYSSAEDVEATLTGTTPETQYRYRIVATDANGTSYGVGRLFTPHWVDRLETESASSISRFGATLNGSFVGNGESTEYRFEWGLNSEYGSETTLETTPGSGGPTSISATLTGLQPGTVYHYRVVAENGEGESKAEDRTFETLPAVLDIATEPASDLSPHTATLNGSFTGTEQDTQYYFEWGQSTNYGNVTDTEDAGGGVTGASNTISSAISSGLEPETKYHYRVVATNNSGTSVGEDQELTTAPAVAAVTTEDAVASGLEGLTLNGSFVGNGEPTSFYFEYGLTNSYGEQTAAPPGASAGSPGGPEPTDVSAQVPDFRGSSTYHYRLVATNGQGTSYGADRVVNTVAAEAPTVGAIAVSGVGRTEASVAASIVPNRWSTVYLFEYGPTVAYGSSTLVEEPLPGDFSDHRVGATLSELSPATQYHVRAVAINFAGTSYGPDQTFITPDVPHVDATESAAVTTTTAHLSGLVAPSGSDTSVHFEYGTGSAYGSSTPPVAIGSGLTAAAVEADLGGLASGTTYHFRIVATNALGSLSGPDQTFATQQAAAPPVERNPGTKKCKKGFVKRHGKCVKKKPRAKPKHRGRKGKGHGHA